MSEVSKGLRDPEDDECHTTFPTLETDFKGILRFQVKEKV